MRHVTATRTSTRVRKPFDADTLKVKRVPSQTPGGSYTVNVRLRNACPEPSQGAHASPQTSPRPPQLRQVERTGNSA